MKYKTRFLAFFTALTLFHLAASFAHPVTPTIIQELNLHDYMFGLALAVMMIGNFLMSPFWGKANLYLSSGRSLFLCCMGYSAAQLWFAYAETEAMILLARLFAGVFIGGAFVSFLTYVVNVARPEDQGKYLTISATIHSVAGAFGYLIGGLIGEYSIKAAFLAQSAVLALAGVLFLAVCLPDAQSHKKMPAKQLLRDVNPLKSFLDSRYFMNLGIALLFTVNILINFGNTGFDQVFNYYLKDQLGLSSAYNGVIKAAVGMVSFVFNTTLCLWIIGKTDNRKSMMVLVLVCTAAAAGTAVSSRIGWFIAYSIALYAGYSVSLPVLQNMVARQADLRHKNLVMGFYNATKSLGSIVGSLMAGFVYSLGAKLPFICVAVIYALAIPAAAGYWIYTSKQKKT